MSTYADAWMDLVRRRAHRTGEDGQAAAAGITRGVSAALTSQLTTYWNALRPAVEHAIAVEREYMRFVALQGERLHTIVPNFVHEHLLVDCPWCAPAEEARRRSTMRAAYRRRRRGRW